MTADSRLTRLTAGMVIPYGGDRYTTVSDALASAFQPGDRLQVVQRTGALLHIPAAVQHLVEDAVSAAADAFRELPRAAPGAVAAFYDRFADALEDEATWQSIVDANQADVRRAQDRGRSTTRLTVSDRMRSDMISGLRSWVAMTGITPVVGKVDHPTWTVETVRVPLGIIGFVFEGRPNVFADAAGVLATGNTAVLRIGSDALGTARAIVRHALHPALAAAGLPTGAVTLLDAEDRAAGWALFSDRRLALAVARGSGHAVLELGSVARQAGIPVSAHGTGGAWMVVDPTADTARFGAVVQNSLDRKVCNTLNVCCIPVSRAAELVPVFLDALRLAGSARGQDARLHVLAGSEAYLPHQVFTQQVKVQRAEGASQEPFATLLAEDALGREWEWEDTPEVTLAIVQDVAEAVALFNRWSPRFVASLIATDADAHARFRADIDAPFVGDGFTRWVDGQYALGLPELGLSNWENGRLLGRGGVLSGADLTALRLVATHQSPGQHR
ncbi:aldehyde dehydrogenase family protein [Pigmentiphaga litoralis]|uniref:aldehyde dehydrogenase family protein n=1 Tax=Pigmentiphaga litoralis TaxID=516702 RepID=UPI003B430558